MMSSHKTKDKRRSICLVIQNTFVIKSLFYLNMNLKIVNTFKIFYVGVYFLATYFFLNFQIEPEFVAGIDPGMAFTPFPSSILDKMRFKHTTFRLRVEFTILD
jgi:hypothetical protein